MPHTRAAEAVVVGLRLLRQFEIATKGLPMQEFGDSRVSMSIGVSQIDLSRPVNAEQLVSHADEAMYAAKNAGKRRVMVRLREAIIVASESADVAAVSDALSVADAGN